MGNTVFGEKSAPQPFSAVTSPVGKATLDFLDWHSFFFFSFFLCSPEKWGSEWKWGSKQSQQLRAKQGTANGAWGHLVVMAWRKSHFCCWDTYLFVFKKKKGGGGWGVGRNTSFYGLMSKKLFRHLKWVMWKIVWSPKQSLCDLGGGGGEGGEGKRESLREWEESKNIDFNLSWERAGETSHWNKFLKLPTSWNVLQQNENKQSYKVCLPRKD